MLKTADQLRRGGHGPSLVAALVYFDISFMVWVLLGAVGAYVASDLGLTSFQKGLMVAIPPIGGSMFRLLLGFLGDRYGIKLVGLVSMATVMVPLVWGAVGGGTYAQVLAIGFLLGVAGASFAISLPLASRWYPPELQGLALGITGAGNSGTIVTTLFAPRLAEHFGWHAVFGLATIPIALAWLAFAVLAKEPPRVPVRSGNPLRLLAEPDARWLCGVYSVTFGGFVGFVSFLPIFFVDRFGVSRVMAGGLAALAAASGSLIRPVGGWLADRHGGCHVLAPALASASFLVVMAAVGPGGLVPTTLTIVAALGALGICNGAVFQIVPQQFPERMGSATGLIGAAGGVGGFLLPFGLGAVHAITGSFAPALLIFALAAIAARASVIARRPPVPGMLPAAAVTR